jgi:hypothetical protein
MTLRFAMEIAKAATIIRSEYERLHDLWFGSRVAYPLALLKFVYIPNDPAAVGTPQADTTATPTDFDWGYDYKTHVLQCIIRQSDLDEDGGMPPAMIDLAQGEEPQAAYADDRIPSWATWRWNLVHETCHEYEHRLLGGVATPVGWTLFEKNHLQQKKRIWPQPHQHPVAFYSAVAAFAAYFNLAPDLLHDHI